MNSKSTTSYPTIKHQIGNVRLFLSKLIFFDHFPESK